MVINLDKEWFELVIEAKELGISITEIREFFKRKVYQNTEVIALCTTFNKNEQGYKEWREKNSNGFVFNHFGNTDSAKQMNKIHRANCTYLKRSKDEGKRTHPYEKICSTNLESLKEHLNIPWTYCKKCI